MKIRIIGVLGLLATGLWLFLSLSAPEIRNADSAGEAIICFGDNLTAGVGASEGEDYLSQLSRLVSLPVTPRLVSDQIHPASAGYTVMVAHIHAALKPYMP